jgi:hypothetical protein
MAAPGANFDTRNPSQALRFILRKMGINPEGKAIHVRQQNAHTHVTVDTATTASRQIAIGVKAGVPATNTAADAPTGLGDLCWDSSNLDVYRCTAYTNGTTFTWTKIVD